MTTTRAIPRTVNDITGTWLSEALGKEVSISTPTRVAEGLALVSEIYRVELRGERVPASVLVKISTSNVDSRQSATTYRMYQREVMYYQELAGSSPVRSPIVHFAAWDPETEDSVLVMEDLRELRPGDQSTGLTVDEAAMALEQMAALHARWWGDEGLGTLTWAGSLLDATYYVAIPAGFEMLLPVAKEHFAHVLEPVVPLLDRLHPHINPLQEQLCRAPNTLLHGDFRGDNLLFGTGPSHPPVVVIDWQGVVVGRGTMELGYFLGQSMTIDDRRTHERVLVEKYTRDVGARGVTGLSFDECWDDYRRSLLYCLAYTVLMAGLDLTDPPTYNKLEMMVSRLATASHDLDVGELIG